MRRSGNPVKVAQLGTRQKITPLFRGELAKRPVGIICVAYYYELAPARDSDALAVIAKTRDAPIEIL
jgi:hypothetical protein